MKTRSILPVVTIKPLHGPLNASSDIDYWKKQTPQARIDALESIRKEYHSWKYPDGIRFQRVYTIVKQK